MIYVRPLNPRSMPRQYGHGVARSSRLGLVGWGPCLGRGRHRNWFSYAITTNSARLRASSFVDRKSTRLNSSHVAISYAVFCLKKKNNKELRTKSVNKYKLTDESAWM